MFFIHNKSTLSTVLLLLAAFIWGTGFIATQIALDANYSSSYIMLTRFALGSFIFGVVFHKDLQQIKKYELIGAVISGTCLFFGFAFQTYGLSYSNPSNNAFITATNIIIVPFLSLIIFKTKVPLKNYLVALLCFVSVLILSIRSQLNSFGIGELLTFIGAICFACHTVAVGHYATRIDTKKLNFIQLCTAAIFSLLLFLIVDRNLSQFKPEFPQLSILYLAVFSTCIAYFLQTYSQKYSSPSKVAIIISSESLFAAIFSVALKYDELSPQLIIGGLGILASVLITEIDIPFFKKQ